MLFMKKGMSPTVGVTLLILMVIIIGGTIFIWSRSLVLEDKEQALAEKLCRDVKFVVGDFCYEVLDDGNATVIFSGRNDISESRLYGFRISVDYGGKVVPISSLAFSEIEGGTSKFITSDIIEGSEGIEHITVVPKIEVGKNVFTCEEIKTVIPWEEMEAC